MKHLASGFLILLLSTGCATNVGPKMIQQQRPDYNKQFMRSQNEQLLLNLVRLRYNETPLFLELSTIVTQYTAGNSADLTAFLDMNQASGVKPSFETRKTLGLGMDWSERPTVTYTPLQGEDFARQILTPVDPSTIVLLSQSGWSISRLLLLCVQRMNGLENAVTAAGPTPSDVPEYKKFQDLSVSLRDLQKAGLLAVDVSEEDGKESVHMLLPPASAEKKAYRTERDETLNMLGINPSQTDVKVSSSIYKSREGELSLNTRSLLGILFFLSQSVQTPQAHQKENLVTVTRDSNGSVFDWSDVLGPLMEIRSSSDKPDNAFVSVPYRDYWFYIQDTDLNSKATFSLLNYLFALQSAEGQGKAPVLTLSASA